MNIFWQKLECHIFVFHCMRIHKGYGHIWHCCRQTFGHPLSAEKIQHFPFSCFLVPCHNSFPFVWKFEKIVYILWQLFCRNFFVFKKTLSLFFVWPRNCVADETESLFSLVSIHGLRTPNEAFFHWNPEFLGLGRQIGQINSGAFGVFSDKLSASILVQCSESLVHVFHYSTIISTKNKVFISTSKIFIWDWDLNLGCKELGI